MVVDPSMSAVGEVILVDRPCPRCSYNLRGLEIGGRCPECGTPVMSSGKYVRFADNLTDAPVSYIHRLGAGFALMSVGLFGLLAQPIVGAMTGSIDAVLSVALMSAGLWWLGCWLVVTQRPKSERSINDPVLDNQTIRRLALWSQGVFMLAGALVWAAIGAGGGRLAVVLLVLAGLVQIAGLFALVPLAVFLSGIADWAGETSLGGRLRGSAWVIALLGGVAVVAGVGALVPTPLQPLMSFLVPFGVVLTGLAVLVLAFSVLQLLRSSIWAARNAVSGMERDARLAERKRRAAEGIEEPEEQRDPEPCKYCKYDLAGVPHGAPCPECGRMPAERLLDSGMPPHLPEPDAWDPQHEPSVPMATEHVSEDTEIHHAPTTINAKRRRSERRL